MILSSIILYIQQKEKNKIQLSTLKGEFLHNCAVLQEQKGVDKWTMKIWVISFFTMTMAITMKMAMIMAMIMTILMHSVLRGPSLLSSQ